MTRKTATTNETLTIAAPKFQVAVFRVEGVAPYVQYKFSAKARAKIRETQEAGQAAKKGRMKDPKDFEQTYQEAIHRLPDGSCGIPAPAFRNACIDACRLCGYAMTRTKMSVFCEPDGFDPDDGTPLVRITRGEPQRFDATVRNASGVCDIRPRPLWQPGWQAEVRLRFDADQFQLGDLANLLTRAGMQVGIGEGRPYSKNSFGMGWGLFRVLDDDGPQDGNSTGVNP